MAETRQETQQQQQQEQQQQLKHQSHRLKRNSACTSCRDAKVRCIPNSNAEQACQRCAKLQLTCVVDITHKRISRRSKLSRDELAREIQSIKQSVGSTSTPKTPHTYAVFTPSRELAAQQTFRPSSPVSSRSTSRQNVTATESLPRTLGSYPFSGEDIDYYFQKFFECYHPYMPIIRHKDPNKCYKSCPLLFWTIIYVASRRYAKSTSLIPFLSEEIRRQVFGALGDLPLSLNTINAITLICTWMFPGARFNNDPSTILSNVTANGALQLGLHTGRGGHPEYSHGTFQNNYTDEEATYTWAGLNIVSQRVSSFMGLPPVTSLFNQTIQNTIDERMPFHVPLSFRILLECQKFSNHVNKLVLANLEESSGVSVHIVQVLEGEWNILQGMICSERADDLDRFNAQLVQLEIQTFYMMPPKGHSPRALHQPILRLYHTASSILQNALDLEQKMGFLSHVTHLQMRSLEIEETATKAIEICARMSIVEGDLANRLATLLRTFLGIYHQHPHQHQNDEEPTVTAFPHRLGASVAFDCFFRWKVDGAVRARNLHPNNTIINTSNMNRPVTTTAFGEGGADQGADVGDTKTTILLPGNNDDNNTNNSNSNTPVPDPLAIDWTFMDDFEWNLGPTPMTIGGNLAPAVVWHGSPR